MPPFAASLLLLLFRSWTNCVVLSLILISAHSSVVQALQRGDRMPVLVQSMHDGWQSPWLELSLSNMPRFRVDEESTVHIQLPRPTKDPKTRPEKEEPAPDTEMGKDQRKPNPNINPKKQNPNLGFNKNEDIKLSLTFSEDRIIIPNVIVFDADEIRSLQTLLVTFVHDGFNIIRIEHQTLYGQPIKMLDTSHPSLTAFHVQYRWESLEEEDFGFAVTAMFSLSVVVVTALGYAVYSSHPITLTSRPSKNEKEKLGTKGKTAGSGGGLGPNSISNSNRQYTSASYKESPSPFDDEGASLRKPNSSYGPPPSRSDGVNGSVNSNSANGLGRNNAGMQYRPAAASILATGGSRSLSGADLSHL